LSIVPQSDHIQLQWDREFPADSGVTAWQEYNILTSDDLSNWSPHSFIRSQDSEGSGLSTLNVPLDSGAKFFRLERHLVYAHRSTAAAPPALYEQQYDNAFNSTLTFAEFTAQTADPSCLAGIDWDPTTAAFFTEYNTTPQDHNLNLPTDDPERRAYNFTLNEAELKKFQTNGFVVSPRVKVYDGWDETKIAPTAVDLYYAIWTDDLPVFITADSILDAWHQSFASILEELEEIALFPDLKQLLIFDWPAAFNTTTSAWDPTAATTEENARVQQAIDDVSFYHSLAASFIQTTAPSNPVQAQWYQEFADPNPEQLTKTGLYGDSSRFSRPNLYKPRGHYTRSAVLSAYFRSMVWLSRAQFHIAHSNPTPEERLQQDRELRAAVLLSLVIRDGDLLEDWQALEKKFRGIAGQSVAMTVGEMIALLEAKSLDSLTSISSPTALATLRTALLSSTYGIQEINGGYFESPEVCTGAEIEQPRALSLFGQRWTPDSWNFQKVVAPEVRENGAPLFRRLPSGLDVAYSTLGNNTAAPILAERMQNQEGVPFRDGYHFHQNLAALRSVFDSQEETFWTEHLYGRWIHGLRALSPALPPTAPDTFRTTAWKRRILNTQLASWTQLRHDTLLYAKQSFTPPLACEFPDGYVDPYPELWQRLSDIALAYHRFVDAFDYEGFIGLENELFEDGGVTPLPTHLFSPSSGYSPEVIQQNPEIESRVRQFDRGERLATIKNHLLNFSHQCLTLNDIAKHQLDGQEHTPEMKIFIENTVENFESIGYTGGRLYNGWFPGLYFNSFRQPWDEHPSSTWNPVVVDVHTDARDICSGDLGAILHEGTGRVQFMLTAVQHPDGSACTFGGPVMSHYEFTKPLGIRLSDEEWLQTLNNGEEPTFSPWKESYLVPTAEE
jgi:hypothetical protein